jgi:hypothetical protein
MHDILGIPHKDFVRLEPIPFARGIFGFNDEDLTFAFYLDRYTGF